MSVTALQKGKSKNLPEFSGDPEASQTIVPHSDSIKIADLLPEPAANFPFDKDALLRLRDEIGGLEDPFNDVGAAVLAINSHLTVQIDPRDEDAPAIAQERVRDFVSWIVWELWPLLADGLIGPARALALLEEISGQHLPLARDDTRRLIECLVGIQIKWIKVAGDAHA
jgi:hypothetical protein